ncbi:hypothetical protein [Clostridium cylindrosporum]|uniref:Uncharacterized protein n=1 Tax=Clostridium cylindrosporum DSM 605 TaxID=1121307 RepID=A0A0J8G024_CLOCY|nr:hypothetical protein [Clostridium cylindrosporum]KMT21151.1 hypothetical protein CLCY_1c03850 [Clostridium cylindrosporum DSM 605]
MLKFSNTRDTAKAVVNELNYFKKQYSAKPSERIKMDRALWSISKGGESISFRYGKYALMQDTNNIYCGISVEKGLCKELSEYYPKALIMTDEWFFYNFIAKLRIGEIKKVLQDISGSIKKPVYIEIIGSTPGVKSDQGGTYTKFQFTDEGLSLLEQLPSISDKIDTKELEKSPNLHLNKKLSSCTTLGEVADVVNSMEKSGELNFILLDFFIWIPFSKQDSSLEGIGLSEKEIIDLVFKPLNKCIS